MGPSDEDLKQRSSSNGAEKLPLSESFCKKGSAEEQTGESGMLLRVTGIFTTANWGGGKNSVKQTYEFYLNHCHVDSLTHNFKTYEKSEKNSTSEKVK
jgi:hypothetical protein